VNFQIKVGISRGSGWLAAQSCNEFVLSPWGRRTFGLSDFITKFTGGEDVYAENYKPNAGVRTGKWKTYENGVRKVWPVSVKFTVVQ